LWALIPAVSLGFLAPVPFAHAAVRLKQRRMWAVTAAYGVCVVVAFVFAGAPQGSWRDAVFGALIFVLTIGGTVHAFVLRGRVFAAPPAEPAAAAAPAAAQREEASASAPGDVALAGELRIGHPGLLRQAGEGGLVDVNQVPAHVLVDRLGLSPAQASQVVQAHERLGGFAGPQELIAGSGLPAATVNGLRERLLLAASGRTADTHDDRPGRPSPGDGKGMPAGWYPDPARSPGRRYWDGTHWGRLTEPATSPFSRWAAAACLIPFAAACVLPALLFKVIPDYPGAAPPSTEEWPGLALLGYGPLAVLSGQFGWLANPAFVGAVIAVLLQKWRLAVFTGAAGFLIAFDTLRMASTPVLNGDTDSTLALKQLLPGFYLWLASFAMVVACGLLGMRRSRAAATGGRADTPPGRGPEPPAPRS
jgi:hypothetical protein